MPPYVCLRAVSLTGDTGPVVGFLDFYFFSREKTLIMELYLRTYIGVRT